jgi:hypothetical protein
MATATLSQRIQLEGGDKIRVELERIGKAAGDALTKLKGGSTGAVPAQQDLNKELAKTREQLDGVAGESLLSLRTKILLVGAAVTGAVAGWIALAKAAADSANEQKNAADKIGVSIRSLREISSIAQVFGVSADAITSAYGNVQDALTKGGDISKKVINGFTEVRKGVFQFGTEIETTAVKVGQFYETMRAGRRGFELATEANKADIALRRVQKSVDGASSALSESQKFLNDFVGGLAKFRDKPLDLFEKVAQELEKIPDPARRAFLITKLGLESVGPLINDGVAAFKKYRQALQDVGAFQTLTQDQQKASSEFARLFTTIELAIKSNREKTRIAFVEALVDPLDAVLGLLRARGAQVNGFLSVLAKSAGKLAGDVIRAFTPTGVNAAGGLVFGLDVEKISETNKWVITLRDTVVSFGKQTFEAIRRVVVPAWQALIGAVVVATRAVNEFFGTNFGDAELAIGGVLLKLSGFFKLLGGAVVLATGTFGRFALAVGAAAALITADSTEAVAKAVQRIKDFFTGAYNEITAGGQKTEAAVAKVASSIKRIEFPKAEVQSGDVGRFAQFPKPESGDTAEWQKLLGIVRELRTAVLNAYENVKLLFTSASSEGGIFTGVLRTLLDLFNAIFGTQFTAGGAAIVAVFLAMTGLLTPILVGLAALSTLFVNLAGLALTVTAAVGSFAFGLAGIQTAALAAGGGITGFAAVAGAAFRNLIALALRFVGWPVALLAGIGTVYTYWDNIVAYATSAGSKISSFFASIWSKLFGSEAQAQIAQAEGRLGQFASKVPLTDVDKNNESADSLKDIIELTEKAAGEFKPLGDAAETAADQVRGAFERIKALPEDAIDAEAFISPFRRIVEAVTDLFAVQLPSALQSAAATISSVMSSIADSVESTLARIEEALSRARAAASEASSLGGGGGSGEGFATGGYVRGSGSGTSDSIPAWLSNGEFVIRAAAVRQYGLSFLRAVNGMRLNPGRMKLGMPAFAMGGLVDTASRLAPIPAVGGGGAMPGASFNLVIGGEMFPNLYAPENTAAALQRYAASAQTRSLGRKPGWYK